MISRTRRTIQVVRRLFNVILVAMVCSVVALYIFASVKAYDTLTLPPPQIPHATPQGQYEIVSFPSRGQDYPVYGFFLPATNSQLTIINVHGYKGSRFAQDQLNRAAYLRDLGYNVLSIDLSDHAGETVGNGRIGMGYSERWDVLGAFDYLISKGTAPEHIGLVGESMGAATILLAAAIEPRIKAIWADTSYSRADTIIRERTASIGLPLIIVPGGLIAGWLTSGDRLWEAAPIDAASTLAAHHQAVYLIHSLYDGTIAFHHAIDIRDAYQAAGVDITFWEVVEGDHAQAILFHQEAYLRRLDEFFKRNLAN